MTAGAVEDRSVLLFRISALCALVPGRTLNAVARARGGTADRRPTTCQPADIVVCDSTF